MDADITRKTLDHYERNARQFFAGTIDHDVSQNIGALLAAITAPPPFTLLDFGCGPGRDLKTFAALGHRAIGLDGATEFAAMAREYSGCEVWQQDFLQLDLPAALFDGVFANASLFHVPRAALPRVLGQLHAALKPGGVLFSSNPRGDNQEGWNGPRYGSYHDFEHWRAYVEAAGFTLVDHYYRPPGLPRDQQPWLATVWRKHGGSADGAGGEGTGTERANAGGSGAQGANVAGTGAQSANVEEGGGTQGANVEEGGGTQGASVNDAGAGPGVV